MDFSIQIISFSNGNEQTSNLLLIITCELLKTEIQKNFFSTDDLLPRYWNFFPNWTQSCIFLDIKPGFNSKPRSYGR